MEEGRAIAYGKCIQRVNACMDDGRSVITSIHILERGCILGGQGQVFALDRIFVDKAIVKLNCDHCAFRSSISWEDLLMMTNSHVEISALSHRMVGPTNQSPVSLFPLSSQFAAFSFSLRWS